jgi:hypothetical protein
MPAQGSRLAQDANSHASRRQHRPASSGRQGPRPRAARPADEHDACAGPPPVSPPPDQNCD